MRKSLVLLAIAAVLAPAPQVAEQRPVKEKPEGARHFVTRKGRDPNGTQHYVIKDGNGKVLANGAIIAVNGAGRNWTDEEIDAASFKRLPPTK